MDIIARNHKTTGKYRQGEIFYDSRGTTGNGTANQSNGEGALNYAVTRPRISSPSPLPPPHAKKKEEKKMKKK